MQAEFDPIAQNYKKEIRDALGFWGWAGHRAFTVAKRDFLVRHLRKQAELRAMVGLDFGCGFGELREMMAERCRVVAGVDPALEMLRAAGDPFCVAFDGASVPMKTELFDFAYASCVIHHVHPSARGGVLREIWRILKPGGYFFMIEHNLSNPLTRRLLKGCAMDADAQFLAPAEGKRLLGEAGFDEIASEYLVFSPAPSLPVLRSIEGLLAKLPIGAQFATIGRKPF